MAIVNARRYYGLAVAYLYVGMTQKQDGGINCGCMGETFTKLKKDQKQEDF